MIVKNIILLYSCVKLTLKEVYMTLLTKLDRISLKSHPEINESIIQEFIFNNPSVLGLGELIPITREKTQPVGGRLDILLGSDDGVRYEVEIQLGSTDPSHIIRTIEYWDTERKRYPNYDHCAVIIAEEITSRFMNVISLFNGHIPLIAIQVAAYKVGDKVSLTFTKVLDKLTLGTDEEEQYEITDRNYWNNRSTPKMLKNVDSIFENISQFAGGYDLKYNKFYIGVSKDGTTKNFVMFRPKKNFLYLVTKGSEDSNKITQLENAGLDVNYQARWKEYNIKLSGYEEYKKHQELLDSLIKESMDYLSIG